MQGLHRYRSARCYLHGSVCMGLCAWVCLHGSVWVCMLAPACVTMTLWILVVLHQCCVVVFRGVAESHRAAHLQLGRRGTGEGGGGVNGATGSRPALCNLVTKQKASE